MGLFDIFKTKSKVMPEELAHRVFSSFVIEEEQSVMNYLYDGIKNAPGFETRAFERQKFIYLAASVATALTNASSRDRMVIAAIPYFRSLITMEMQKRWSDGQDLIDLEIERAATDYGKLIFTNPEENRGLAFDWSRDWLARIGVDETNPASLILMSTAWKAQFLQMARYLSRIRVVNDKN